MRWISDTDWRSDMENAELYLETALAMARGAEWTKNGPKVPDPFKAWAERLLPTDLLERCVFLGPNGTYAVKDVEIGVHGHLGPNGARGSQYNMSKLGTKIIHGHFHGPYERDGAMGVGTSSELFMGYNVGPTNWLHTHGVLYADGKRTLVNIIDGRVTPA